MFHRNCSKLIRQIRRNTDLGPLIIAQRIDGKLVEATFNYTEENSKEFCFSPGISVEVNLKNGGKAMAPLSSIYELIKTDLHGHIVKLVGNRFGFITPENSEERDHFFNQVKYFEFFL
jgi:hypothetical protein